MPYVRLTLLTLIAVLCIGTLSTGLSLAQEPAGGTIDDSARSILPEDQLSDFHSRRLSIELIGRQVSSYETFSGAAGADWHRWQAYRGEEPISEQEFLLEAGHYRFAQEAATFHKDARHNLIAGVFLTLLGGAATYVGYNMEDYLDSQHGPSVGMMVSGITISGLGAALSVSNTLKTRRQWAPFSRAYDISSTHNRELLEELRERP